MWKSKAEIKRCYVDHLDSVRMSGLGHESSRSEILAAMLEEEKRWEEDNNG